MQLYPYQRKFVAAVFSPRFDVSVLSSPWSTGKSHLLAECLFRVLSPDSRRFESGTSNFLVSASLKQAVHGPFRLLREFVEGSDRSGEYRISESTQQARILHLPTGTGVSVWAVSGKRSMGLVRVGLVACDEPASWALEPGELMEKVLRGALLKPGGVRRLCVTGTLSPAPKDHWWPKLVRSGTCLKSRRYVQVLQGDAETWDEWPTICRSNPLLWKTRKGRTGLLAERDEARTDPSKKSDFLSYRLNVPSVSEESMLLTVAQWKRVLSRTLRPRRGRPIIGVDIGHAKSWTGAVVIWPETMRTEVYGVCPDTPLDRMEREDEVPRGSYRRLVDEGSLIIDHGREVPRLSVLWSQLAGLYPQVVVCDRFRVPELRDTVAGQCPVHGVLMRWSESTRAIRDLRAVVVDGDLNVAVGSRRLLELSLAQSRVVQDDAGNVRLLKGGGRRKGRHRRRSDSRGVSVVPDRTGPDPRFPVYGGPMSLAHRKLNRRRWALLRRTVLDDEHWTCRKCRRYGNEVDHVIPLEQSGDPWSRENLQVLCRDCHVDKTRTENRRRVLTGPERDWRDHVHNLGG